jgi:dolichyl-phosphate beta-glucosyltransferase
VEWNEIEGSKMKVMGMVRMALDLIQIALFHRLGLWSVRMKADIIHPEIEP